MYNFHITDMAEAVATRLGLDGDGRQAAQDALAGYWGDKIAITWTIEDIRSCRKDISDDDAMEALQTVLHGHDATLGVTWDTLVAACGGDYPSGDDDEDDIRDRVPSDWPVQPLDPGATAKGKATCGVCGLSWDDSIITSMTPAPSARCPFESFHRDDEEDADGG